MQYIIDGSKMTDRESAHRELARALSFPEYYGENLDALWDLTVTMAGDALLTDTTGMLNALEGYGCRILQVLYEAAKANAQFTFRAE